MIDGKRLGVCIAAALLAAALSFPLPALAAMNADQVKAKVAKAFGVEVLKVRPGKADGRKVFVVTVMNPGGDFNEAFQVSTIVVDVETGKLVSGYRQPGSIVRTQPPFPGHIELGFHLALAPRA